MKTHRTLLSFAVFALLSAPAVAQKMPGPHPAPEIPAPQLLETTGVLLQRFAKVGDDLFITGQPKQAGLRELKKRGVTTIVNLRTPPEMEHIGFDEPALIKELGMKYVYLPGDATMPYSPATVASFAKVMEETTDGKVALHCTVAWRASHLWAAYLIKDRGVEVNAALDNARAINLGDKDMRMPMPGRQPVEQFRDRDLPQVNRGGKAP